MFLLLNVGVMPQEENLSARDSFTQCNTSRGVLKQNEIPEKAFLNRVKYWRRRSKAEGDTTEGVLNKSEMPEKAF